MADTPPQKPEETKAAIPFSIALAEQWLARIFGEANLCHTLKERHSGHYFRIYTDKWESCRHLGSPDDMVALFMRQGIDADTFPNENIWGRHGCIVIHAEQVAKNLAEVQRAFGDLIKGGAADEVPSPFPTKRITNSGSAHHPEGAQIVSLAAFRARER
jgi:hypothetical protein